jgi:hypothetical protein
MGIISERIVTSFSECGVNPKGYFAYTKVFLMTPEKTIQEFQAIIDDLNSGLLLSEWLKKVYKQDQTFKQHISDS